MILSDREIKKYIKSGKIKINPMPDLKKQLGSTSLDMRLGSKFRVFSRTENAFIDIKDEKTFLNLTEMVEKKDNEPFIVHPGEFILGMTKEFVELPEDIAVRIDGKSSLGRLGLVIHSTAGHVDPGFSGNITLEIANIGNLPILLYPNMNICQFVFEMLSSPAEVLYKNKKTAKYVNQKNPGASKIAEEWKKKK
ncbi:dCTP deaminase [Candidatus Wolfebacteria bacterium]|nr:dCTP deaminase [Candidatus Wolfebacteria bacterium]